jgi:hypothetical protein
LDGNPATTINADLSTQADFAGAIPLIENSDLCFQGIMKGGPFDLTEKQAQHMISAPLNPNGRPNSDVVKRRLIGRDVLQRNQNGWLIDFGDMTESEAALYEVPFEYVVKYVKPVRDVNHRKNYRDYWWKHQENRPGLRRALKGLKRCIVTSEVAKHRVFVWMNTDVVPDKRLHVIARDDDYFIGLLQSRAHVLWSLRVGSTLEDRPMYNSDTTFNTFPFPWPPGKEPKDDLRVEAIAATARELVKKRDAWLNPPDASTTELKKRTLTNLYNQNPTWLQDAHRELDVAVFAAYGWPKNLSDQDILTRLLHLNTERSRPPI